MHSGNGHTIVLFGNGADHVHDLGLVVLIQVSQDLGFTGSATGGLQKRFAQQIPALNFDTLIQVCIQDALFFDKCLNCQVIKKPIPVSTIFDNVNQCGISPALYSLKIRCMDDQFGRLKG